MAPRWVGRLRRKARQALARVVRAFRTPEKTESELLFESYLAGQGIRSSYEPPVDGTARRPDYRAVIDHEPVRFEVKQFEADADDARLGSGVFDPYEPVRLKLNTAASQLKALKGKEACCVVLFNVNKPLVGLGPLAVLGAMLGDITFTFPVDTDSGIGDLDAGQSVFGARGSMVRPGRGERPPAPQKTTISATIVLSRLNLGERRLRVALRREEIVLGRDLTLNEVWERIQKATGTGDDVGLRELRVLVCENPSAAKPLPGSFGRGLYDERFAFDSSGRAVRTYVGDALAALENAEREVGEYRDPLRF